MACKRKTANAPSQTERRSSSRVQELRKKSLDEKERLVRDRVKLLSDDETSKQGVKTETETALHVTEEKSDGNDADAHLKVRKTLILFNKMYLLSVQAEEKRPDLKAVSKVIRAEAVLYPRKRIGDLPGIDVGHRFFSRAEMCAKWHRLYRT